MRFKSAGVKIMRIFTDSAANTPGMEKPRQVLRIIPDVNHHLRLPCGLIVLLACLLAASPATRPTPSAQPPGRSLATQPTTARSHEDLARLMKLTRESIRLLQAGKLDDAEKSLAEALGIAPRHQVNLYNMACLRALKNDPQAAMDYLERSAEEGFTDFIHIAKDPDLNSLRELPRYRALLARKDELQHKAAEAVLKWLKSELGQGYIFEIDEKDKLVFATNTDRQTLEDLRKLLLRQAHSQWEQLFAHRPDQYISVVIASAADFRQIVHIPGVGGFYNHENRILIAARMGQVMLHEFTHALHGADLETVGQEHVTWVSEGLATLFEAAHYEEDKLIPSDGMRLAQIQSAARRKALIPLRRLVEMDQGKFVASATNAYGQSGSIMLYLYERGLLRQFYETYKATYDQDKTARLALEKTTGKTLAAFEDEWKAWMLKRTAPRPDTGPQGTVLGVRFTNSNDGLRAAGIVAGAPAAKAGLHEGDVLVGIDDTDVRDQESLVAVLADAGPASASCCVSGAKASTSRCLSHCAPE